MNQGIISGMTGMEETNESDANLLCKSCGLCCTGHLFSQTKLRSAELDSAEAFALNVFRSVPRQRGFSQPCPLWHGQCTIYTSPHYPHFCRTYKCKLLKRVLDDTIPLSTALTVVQQTKGLIDQLEALLPGSPDHNFRERLVARLEQLESLKESDGQDNVSLEFHRKADALLNLYKNSFGVEDLVDKPEEEYIE
jgi:uncharacterized protein